MKKDLLEKVRSELKLRLERLAKAAMDAHAAATDPGSKAESKYDTRNLEASYLASGQARHVEEMAKAVRIFESLTLPEFEMDEPIEAGALVEVDMDDGEAFFLLVPAAGGLSVMWEDREITLLTPESGLYQKLLGLNVGDQLDHPPLMVMEVS